MTIGPSIPEAGDNGDKSFRAIDEAAKKASTDPSVNQATSSPNSEWQPQTEQYNTQVTKNMAAFRKMRWVTFSVLGLLCIATLLAFALLLYRFIRRLLNSAQLAETLARLQEMGGWHAFVFIAILFAIFAVVPLSLGGALVKMVSNSRDDGHDLKIPATEMLKVMSECLRHLR